MAGVSYSVAAAGTAFICSDASFCSAVTFLRFHHRTRPPHSTTMLITSSKVHNNLSAKPP